MLEVYSIEAVQSGRLVFWWETGSLMLHRTRCHYQVWCTFKKMKMILKMQWIHLNDTIVMHLNEHEGLMFLMLVNRLSEWVFGCLIWAAASDYTRTSFVFTFIKSPDTSTDSSDRWNCVFLSLSSLLTGGVISCWDVETQFLVHQHFCDVKSAVDVHSPLRVNPPFVLCDPPGFSSSTCMQTCTWDEHLGCHKNCWAFSLEDKKHF